jgi:hypothetical protein
VRTPLAPSTFWAGIRLHIRGPKLFANTRQRLVFSRFTVLFFFTSSTGL